MTWRQEKARPFECCAAASFLAVWRLNSTQLCCPDALDLLLTCLPVTCALQTL